MDIDHDCAEKFCVDLFSILSKSHTSFKTLETILVLYGRLSLYKQKECLQGLNIISIESSIHFFSYSQPNIFLIFILFDIIFD